MATQMNVIELTRAIEAATERFAHTDAQASDHERKELVAACAKLQKAVDAPANAGRRAMYAMLEPTALRIAMDMGMFDAAAAVKGQPLSLGELTAWVKPDQQLACMLILKSSEARLSVNAVRIMRLLVSADIFREAGDGKYLASPIAGILSSSSPLSDGLIRYFDVHAPTLVKLPEYLRRNGFRNPESATAAPFQYAFDTPLHHFEWLKHNPRQLEAFNRLMTAQRQGVDWFEYYPVEDRLVRPWRAEADSVFLVDIGGGIGHDLIKFHERYPDIHGKLILQDLPSSIESIRDMPSAISPMAHDFFTPNPVRGARVYYMRSILHDWPDHEARKILANIRCAMTEDSLLLLSEYVLPDADAPPPAVQLDLSMMAIYAGMERTQALWETLLQSASFEIVKIWRPTRVEPESASLIEARPA